MPDSTSSGYVIGAISENILDIVDMAQINANARKRMKNLTQELETYYPRLTALQDKMGKLPPLVDQNPFDCSNVSTENIDKAVLNIPHARFILATNQR